MKTQLTKTVTATILVIAALSTITLPSASATLNSGDIDAAPYVFIYKPDGNYPMDHYVNTDCLNPIIYTDNATTYIRVSVGGASQVYVSSLQGTIMFAGTYLTEVTYWASWMGNKPVTVYRGDSVNHQGSVVFNLTGVPHGNQSIGVSVKSVVLLFGSSFAETYPVEADGSGGVSFRVAYPSEQNQPSQDQSAAANAGLPTETAYTATLTALLISTVAVITAAKKTTNKKEN
jgi:hypothetical protein